MITFDYWTEPSEEVIKVFANAFDIVLHKTECELERLFNRELNDLNSIHECVKALDSTYSTFLFRDFETICNFIHENQIVSRAKDGDISVVRLLADRTNTNTTKNRFVFATKFCSFCNPYVFPIFDSIVPDVLLLINEEIEFDNSLSAREIERLANEFDYEAYISILNRFITHFKLSECISYRDIDKYLWIVGKGL